MDDILFTLPEHERGTIKSFLLMQQERIEKLEKMVYQLQFGRSSKTWRLQGFQSIAELQTMVILEFSVLNLYTQRICYHVDTFDVHIDFLDFRNQLFMDDLLEKIGMKHITAKIINESVCSYYAQSKWKYLQKSQPFYE